MHIFIKGQTYFNQHSTKYTWYIHLCVVPFFFQECDVVGKMYKQSFDGIVSKYMEIKLSKSFSHFKTYRHWITWTMRKKKLCVASKSSFLFCREKYKK